ncbi:MAG TPA: GNAT family N-acetyltransferase [Streptosporangiales bacterium]
MRIDDLTLAGAGQTARELAERAGVEIRTLRDDEAEPAAQVLADIWQTTLGAGPIEAALLIAFLHTDNYVAGAFADGEMVGVCVGFYASAGSSLHSHIAGVRDGWVGRGVGTAMKFHQRAWAIRHGIGSISWTFDPLVARNAYFNVHRLGARVTRYAADFYGVMSDGLNDGQASDRLLVSWDVTVEPGAHAAVIQPPDPRVFPALQMDRAFQPVLRPGVPGDEVEQCRVAVPEDVELLRTRDPDLATTWRYAAREALGRLLGAGWVVTDFDRTDGCYLLERNDS